MGGMVRAVEVGDDRLAVRRRAADRRSPAPGRWSSTSPTAGSAAPTCTSATSRTLFPAGTVPGHEMSGSISAVGDGVTRLEHGRSRLRAAVRPVRRVRRLPRRQRARLRRAPSRTASASAAGGPGGYAEQLVVDERRCCSRCPTPSTTGRARWSSRRRSRSTRVARARPAAGDRIAIVGARADRAADGARRPRRGRRRRARLAQPGPRGGAPSELGMPHGRARRRRRRVRRRPADRRRSSAPAPARGDGARHRAGRAARLAS